MEPEKVVNIAKDFSRFPAGRYESDGEFNGERFRKKFLLPTLGSGKSLTVELDGTAGYGSSFLEEAFGGLVRVHGLITEDLLRLLHLKSTDQSLLEEIDEYIRTAIVQSKK